MQKKLAFCVIFCTLNLISLIVFWLFNSLNLSVFLSFEVGIFSFLLIIITSFLSYKRQILLRASKLNYENPPLNITLKKYKILPKIINFKAFNADLKPNFKQKIQYFSLYFSLLKILAYVILVAGFLYLHRHNLLSVLGFVSGISVLILCVFIFAFYVKSAFK
ncbi:hypothetical protein [Campylobacter sp. LR286c]|uniref:hypothetical protein n=1 Tax=Campylobacter sp. LR286c TaxID=2593545 RepID=UPI001237D5F8|nr:hypothetical protein [Campylobacter sp. LR286c]KAA6227601.1 hypothetical protein FMM57_04050 [Campylobacter sp. LR286c]